LLGENRRRPRMLIPITMVWVARNVVHSGLLKHLVANGVEPVLLVREPPPDGLVGPETVVAPLLTPGGRSTRLDWFIDATLSFAVTRKIAPQTYRLRRDWYERQFRGRTKMRYQTAGFFSAFLTNPRLFEWLRGVWERRTVSSIDLEPVVNQMKMLECDGIWFNNWGMGKESAYVAASKEIGIPAITSIISFDNVLTKGVRPRFDHYIVWSKRAAADLICSDSMLKEGQVSVLGTPQFDFHRRAELIWDRSTTMERLGLPVQGRYFIYGAGREFHSPGEIAMVNRLAEKIRNDPRWGNYRIVVRLHPLDRVDLWARAAGENGIVLCEPFQPPVDDDGWSWSSLEDQALLVSSLYHADACLSVASTIALDAAIMGVPVIGMKIDKGSDQPEEVFFDAFDLDHYRPLVASGGIWMAGSWSETLELLGRAVDHPRAGEAERARMIQSVCGPVNGGSSERTAGELTRFLDSVGTRKTA